jgi:hypothetical protein
MKRHSIYLDKRSLAETGFVAPSSNTHPFTPWLQDNGELRKNDTGNP